MHNSSLCPNADKTALPSKGETSGIETHAWPNEETIGV